MRSGQPGHPPRSGTVGQALEAAAQRWPDDVGWVFGDTRLTRAQMLASADHLAAALRMRGVGPGDRVAVWLPNRPEWAHCLFACARLGAVLVALNTRWKAHEVAYVLEHSHPKLLVLQRWLRDTDVGELVDELGWPAGTGPASGVDVIEVDGPQISGATPWTALLEETPMPNRAGAGQHPQPDGEPSPEDPLLLQYTSGSTAQPKGAVLPHRQVLNYGLEVIDRLGMRDGEAYLSPQPLYHVAGSCLALPAPLARRVRVVFPVDYAVERVLELTAAERCVSRGGTPTMYLDELAHPRFDEFDTSSLRSGWVGAPPSVLDRIRAKYPIDGLINLYAATEGGATWGEAAQPWTTRRMTTGPPLSGTQIHVRDVDSHHELAAGEIGEIGFRGWNQITEYLADPERTAEAFDADGFLHLGDLGFLDEEGHLHYAGRLKDMIRCGGENVAAEEVEAFLLEHPQINQAAVLGRPHPRLGEVIVAVVEPAPNVTLTERDILDFCADRLAGFRAPRQVHFVSTWPTTSTGKIHKPTLRDTYATEPERAAQ